MIGGEIQSKFMITIDIASNIAWIDPFECQISCNVDHAENKIALHIESRKCWDYLWNTYIQFMGCYSPIIHSKRQQWTTGVGERGNRQRRDLLKDCNNMPCVSVYIPRVIEYAEKQMVLLPSECQSAASIKRRAPQKNTQSQYKRRKNWISCSDDENRVLCIWNQAKANLATFKCGAISNEEIYHSWSKFDVEGVIRNKWAKSTQLGKISNINNNIKFSNNLLIINVIERWCKKALSIDSFMKCLEFLAKNKNQLNDANNT